MTPQFFRNGYHIVIGAVNANPDNLWVRRFIGNHASGVSAGRYSYVASELFLPHFALYVMKDTDEGREIKTMLASRVSPTVIIQYLDALLLSCVTLQDIIYGLDRARMDGHDAGMTEKAAAFRQVLGIYD